MCFVFVFLFICVFVYFFTSTGLVTEIDKNTKTCTVSFDDGKPRQENVSFSKIDKYRLHSEYFSNTGAIDRVVAKFSANTSLFTQDVFACLTLKHDSIPIVLPFEFDATPFNFGGIPIGDTICIERDIFETTVDSLSLEIAAEDGKNFYVSVLFFCFF